MRIRVGLEIAARWRYFAIEEFASRFRSYGFRRIENPSYFRFNKLLRIQQQIIYLPPRLHSTWSPVFAPTAPSALDALGVLGATNYMVADAGQITHSAASDKNHRVLLQIVSLAGDVSRDFDVVGESHAGHFSKRRVRLLRRDGANLQANASFLRRTLLQFAGSPRERVSDRSQRRCLRLFASPLPWVSY